MRFFDLLSHEFVTPSLIYYCHIGRQGGKRMSFAYGMFSMIALILLGACIVVDRKKEIWLRLLFISVFICDIGYFHGFCIKDAWNGVDVK